MSRPLQQITAAATLDNSSSGYDVYASGGYFPVTLADPTTYANDVELTVINGDALSGKRLLNFPADVKRILYPKESISVRVVNGQWVTRHRPPRYAIPATTTIYVANEGDDNNDGLSQSSPIKTSARGVQIVQTELDVQQTTVAIALKGGETFDPVHLGGQPTGGNLITLSVWGTGAATVADVGPAISVGDNAELDIRIPTGNSLIIDGNKSNAVDSGALYGHNNPIIDMEGDVTIIGHGANGSAIFFDGPCMGASIANGFKMKGRFRSAFRMDEGGGRYTLSGTVDGIPDANGQLPFIDAMLEVFGENELILGTPFGPHWYSVGPSRIGGDGLIVTNGVGIPGGYSCTQGGRVVVSKY